MPKNAQRKVNNESNIKEKGKKDTYLKGVNTQRAQQKLPTDGEKQMDIEKQMDKAFVLAMKNLPKGRFPELLGLIQTFTENAKYQPIKPKPENKDELTAYGIELYPKFSKRTGEADGLKCLENNYKYWLKAYTPSLDRDYMSQADLGRLDPQLLARLRKLYNAAELNKIIPSEPLFNQQEARTITAKEKSIAIRLQSICYRHTEPT